MKIGDSIHAIQHTTDQIVQTCRDLPEALLRWKPAEDQWSIMEILCHLEEVIPYWLGELQATIQSPQTPWGRGLQHEGRLAAVAVAHKRNVSDVLRHLADAKQQVQDILGAIREDQLAIEAESRNPRFGKKPMSFIVDHLLVEHLAKHLQQIERNIGRFEAADQSQGS